MKLFASKQFHLQHVFFWIATVFWEALYKDIKNFNADWNNKESKIILMQEICAISLAPFMALTRICLAEKFEDFENSYKK